MFNVEVGTDKAVEGYRDANSADPELVRYRDAPGERIVTLTVPDGVNLVEAFRTVVGALQLHIAEGERPVWVESSSAGLTTLLAEHFEIENNERPANWGEVEPEPKGGTVPPGALTTMVVMAMAMLVMALFRMELRTDAGRDYQARVMGDTASTGTGAYASGSYIGLTANATAASAASTTLTAEITTGTLARAQATYAHTNGTATYTLTKTFTSDQTVVVAKLGVFNSVGPGGAATTSNTIIFETLLNATATMVTGDQLQVTETVTM